MDCKECKIKDEIILSQKRMVSGFLHSIGNTIQPELLQDTAIKVAKEGEERYEMGLECVAIMEAQYKQINGLQSFIDDILSIYEINIEGFFEGGKRVNCINGLSSKEYIKLHNKEVT